MVCLLTQPSPTWKCANVARDCILSHYWYYRGTCPPAGHSTHATCEFWRYPRFALPNEKLFPVGQPGPVTPTLLLLLFSLLLLFTCVTNFYSDPLSEVASAPPSFLTFSFQSSIPSIDVCLLSSLLFFYFFSLKSFIY